MPKVTSPVLVIHGTEDEVIHFSHGLAIYEKCPRAVEPLWIEVHNSIRLFREMRGNVGNDTNYVSRVPATTTWSYTTNIWND